MRLLRVIGIILLLIGFPAISWYYLQTGINWRKQGIQEVRVKDSIALPDLELASGQTLIREDMAGKFILIGLHTSDVPGEVYGDLYDQFDHRDDLLYLILGDTPPLPGWMQVDCDKTDCAGLQEQLFKSSGVNIALIDPSGAIRNVYDLSKTADQQNLVKHCAIILPVEKREKIELRRGATQ